ncbi:MAG TPA: hypothetical protein VM120_02455 [Bryobacteraceae bacterium]|nr:hypothetical protein [Bryobacteraceae bacterium]
MPTLPRYNNGFSFLELGGKCADLEVKSATFPTMASLVLEIYGGSSKDLHDILASGVVYAGSIVSCGFDCQETFRENWSRALLQQIQFPALDASGHYDVVLVLTFQMIDVVLAPTQSGFYGSRRQKKRWSGCNFKFEIGGMQSCSRVSKIAAFVPGQDLVITVMGEQSAAEFRSWLQTGNQTRSGALAYLGANFSAELTLSLVGLRIRSIAPFFPTNPSAAVTITLEYQGFGCNRSNGLPASARSVKPLVLQVNSPWQQFRKG